MPELTAFFNSTALISVPSRHTFCANQGIINRFSRTLMGVKQVWMTANPPHPRLILFLG
jgi:hypothetical protein